MAPTTEIEMMTKALFLLENVEEENRNEEYQHIVQSIEAYLRKYCIHEIVVDCIDMGVEETQTIQYCKICNTLVFPIVPICHIRPNPNPST